MIKKINNALLPEEVPYLRMKGYTVAGITDNQRELVNDLAQTCMATMNCVGLTANQIWDDPIMSPPAIFVIRMKDGILPFFNPVLEKQFKKTTDAKEMCMSLPGKKVRIHRPYHVYTSFMDGEGGLHNEHFYDVMARIWLHEYDHIMGKLITDYE